MAKDSRSTPHATSKRQRDICTSVLREVITLEEADCSRTICGFLVITFAQKFTPCLSDAGISILRSVLWLYFALVLVYGAST